MLTDDQEKMWKILKGEKLRHKLDINKFDYTLEQRRVCSIDSPEGIYYNFAEFVETELEIPFEEYCLGLGLDVEKSIYRGVYENKLS